MSFFAALRKRQVFSDRPATFHLMVGGGGEAVWGRGLGGDGGVKQATAVGGIPLAGIVGGEDGAAQIQAAEGFFQLWDAAAWGRTVGFMVFSDGILHQVKGVFPDRWLRRKGVAGNGLGSVDNGDGLRSGEFYNLRGEGQESRSGFYVVPSAAVGGPSSYAPEQFGPGGITLGRQIAVMDIPPENIAVGKFQEGFFPVGVAADAVPSDDVRPGVAEEAVENPAAVTRSHQVVTVEEHHIRSRDRFEASVAGRRSSRGRLGQYGYPQVGGSGFLLPAAQYLRGSVGRAVVNEDDVERTERLGLNRTESGLHDPSAVEYRDYNRQHRLGGGGKMGGGGVHRGALR